MVSLCLLSCSDPVGGPGKSPVFLLVQGGDIYNVVCDLATPNGATVHVKITSYYRDQSDNQPTTDFADVILYEQRVTYFRYDGNPNVPEGFVTALSNAFVDNGGGELDLEILVVRPEAKRKSPLKELAFGGGEGEILLSAYVEFYGKDLMGNTVIGDIDIPVLAGYQMGFDEFE